MAYQSVTVESNSKYRLTGWIRFEQPPAQPVDEAAGDNTTETPATETQPADSDNGAPSGLSPTPIFGACLGLLNRPEISELISTTGDWKQVTLEFTTTESETTISPGCRFGLEGQQISGTAWFDNLKLEKVE